MVRNITKVILFSTLIALFIFGVFQITTAYQRPLAAPLALLADTATPLPPSTATPDPKSNATAVPTAAPTATPVQTCGNTGSQIILFAGSDYAYGEWPFGADLTRYIKVDYSNKKVAIVAFPRDLWVNTKGLTDNGKPIDETRLGLSYYYTKKNTKGTEQETNIAATTFLAQVIKNQFDLKPDQYFTVQMSPFGAMVDTIGGIEINIPKYMETIEGYTFYPGVQVFNGKLATEYLRGLPVNTNDLPRFERQNLVIMALRKKIISLSIIPKIPDLLKQFKDVIATDLSPKQFADLVCMVETVKQEDIKFYEIDKFDKPALITPGGPDGSYLPKVDAIKQYIADAFK